MGSILYEFLLTSVLNSVKIHSGHTIDQLFKFFGSIRFNPLMLALPFQMQQDIRELLQLCSEVQSLYKEPELFVERGYIKRFDIKPERMYPEDLAALEDPVEEAIIDSLRSRLEMGGSYSFIGDILLSLNSNDLAEEFSDEVSIGSL